MQPELHPELITAIKQKDLNAIDQYLWAHPNIQVDSNEFKDLPLNQAAFIGSKAILRKLFAAGIRDINKQVAGTGYTALNHAVLSGSLETVQFLLAHGAKPNGLPGAWNTPLHNAVLGGKNPIVNALLAAGANPLQTTPENTTPVWYSDLTSRTFLIKTMIIHGLRLEDRFHDGRTVLETIKEGVRPQLIEWQQEKDAQKQALFDRAFALIVESKFAEETPECASLPTELAFPILGIDRTQSEHPEFNMLRKNDFKSIREGIERSLVRAYDLKARQAQAKERHDEKDAQEAPPAQKRPHLT